MLMIVDREGLMPVALMREYFESSVSSVPALAKQLSLLPVLNKGTFSHYANKTTQQLWIGFTLGIRCHERIIEYDSAESTEPANETTETIH